MFLDLDLVVVGDVRSQVFPITLWLSRTVLLYNTQVTDFAFLGWLRILSFVIVTKIIK